MHAIREVPLAARSIASLEQAVGPERVAGLRALAARLAESLGDVAVWNVNSTERGGGVAEMLRSIVAYARGAGIDARWAVISGPARFFSLTKRLHNAIHGSAGDATPLDAAARELYAQVTRECADQLTAVVRPGDFVILHDPQTAGLAGLLRHHGARVVWRCHIGEEEENEETRAAWSFLGEFLAEAEVLVFSRRGYVPRSLEGVPLRIFYPTIDPLSAKNEPMSPENVLDILSHTGIIESGAGSSPGHFRREDGSRGRVDRRADIVRLGPAPSVRAPLVVQVSRWDRLKDHAGLLTGFGAILDRLPEEAHLVLAGPNVHAVADDPEGAEVFNEVLGAWRHLPHSRRQRVHLVNLPMEDTEENAAIVNALQRHATVVVQKSLHEGFGLTVAEAMWKRRPVIASRVGGIQDQIVHGVSGLLLDDPRDVAELGDALAMVLGDRERAQQLGAAGQQRVIERFLNPASLEAYGGLLLDLAEGTIG